MTICTTNVKCRSFEDWREKQPTRKEFHKHVNNEDVCDFREMFVEYLDKDVDCLFLLIETMGNNFWHEFRANICLKIL